MLLNACVFDACCHSTLVKWTILRVEDDKLNLVELYQQVSFKNFLAGYIFNKQASFQGSKYEIV